MHESALLRDLRRQVLATADGRPVTRVRLWVGALSHVTEPMLQEHWAELVDGTPASGATLDVEVSADLDDPRAQGVVLRSLDVAEGSAGPTGRAPDS